MSEHRYTRIVIRHDSVDALKASSIWTEAQKNLWSGECVEVVEISVHEYPDDQPPAEKRE
jgi:hypothetical protein